MSTNRHRYKHTPHNPTNRPGSLVVSVFQCRRSPCLCHRLCLLSFFVRPLSSTLYYHFLTCYLLSFFLVWLYGSRLRFFPTCSVALWLPLIAPGPDIKGSMRISLSITSEVHTCTQPHAPTPTHSRRHTIVDHALTNKHTHEWTSKSSINWAGSDLYGRSTVTHHHTHSWLSLSGGKG